MKNLIIILLFFTFSSVLFPETSGNCRMYVKEFQDIVIKKDIKKLIEHLSDEEIEIIALTNPEKWTKAKVTEYLNSKEPNEVKEFFFKVLPEEFEDKNIDVTENSAKDGCNLDSNLRGSGVQVYIREKEGRWIITGFGYI